MGSCDGRIQDSYAPVSGPSRSSSQKKRTTRLSGSVCRFPGIFGRGERIRTSDLSVPNRALYQAEPRPELTALDSM